MNIAVILAGGIGSRVGADVPKQFVEVWGKPVICYTIEKFEQNNNIDAIEVVCVENYIDILQNLIKKFDYKKVKWIVKGGSSFQYSVLNGVNNLKDKCSSDDILLVHYAASPFVTDDIIDDGIKVCMEKGNCVSATPTFLLCGSNDNDKSQKWVDRDKIMQLNSPQCFKYSVVSQIYEEGKNKSLLDKIEPHTTTLMYELGKTIYFSYGNQTNIKITTKEDLELFKAYAFYQNHCKEHH